MSCAGLLCTEVQCSAVLSLLRAEGMDFEECDMKPCADELLVKSTKTTLGIVLLVCGAVILAFVIGLVYFGVLPNFRRKQLN